MTPDAFFDALRADPGDDTTRMVLADWLDDHGEPERAAFIRLAVRLERMPDDHPDRAALLARYTDQRLTHGPVWLGARPDSLEDVGYRGGLVWRAVFRHDAPAADVESFLGRHPVRELSVAGERTLRELARCPVLGLVRSLVVRQGPVRRRARLLDDLFSSPHLRRLDELCLGGDAVDNHLARVLATAPALRDLVVLRLEQTRLDDAGVLRLLAPWGESLPSLAEWHVHCPSATWMSLQHLCTSARARRWRALSWLELRSCGLENLDGLRQCRQLRRLHVVLPSPFRWNPFGRMLGWLEGLSQLEQLSLSGEVHHRTVIELAGWPGLARLERIELRPRHAPGQAGGELLRQVLLRSPHYNRRTKIAVGG
jgi:uncharacterized protein (TIGR02996 family)